MKNGQKIKKGQKLKDGRKIYKWVKQEYYGRSIESRDDPRALKTDLCKISSKSFHELLPRVPIKQPKLKMIFSPLLFALVSPR